MPVVREVAFDVFRAFQIDRIFGNPGSTELPMFREFPDDFRYVLGLQESICVGMADGFAQASRRPALVNLHSAAGVGHALGNIFTAFKNQTPLLITAGQQARSILPFAPYLGAQDAATFPRPYVKWSTEPARAQDVPVALQQALHIALTPPQGPVFVSIPVDDWDRECEPLEIRRDVSSFAADSALIRRVAAALEGASSPAIVVGPGVARDDAWDSVIACAERLGADVWASPMSFRNAFPEDHALFRGFLRANRQAIVERLEPYDVVLVLGAPVFLYHTASDGPHLSAGTTLFHFSDNPSEIAAATSGTAVLTNLKAGLDSLLTCLPERAARRRKAKREIHPPAEAPLSDAYLCHKLAQRRPSGAIIVEEAPSSRVHMQAHLPMLEKDSFFTGASGGLGFGLPAAVGVAMAQPKRRVIALIGDGSAMYSIQGLWSAARAEVNITFVIVRNRSYEALNQFAQHFGLERTLGCDLPGLDFVQLAAAQGVSGVRVQTAAELDAALEQAFATRGATLVEVEVS